MLISGKHLLYILKPAFSFLIRGSKTIGFYQVYLKTLTKAFYENLTELTFDCLLGNNNASNHQFHQHAHAISNNNFECIDNNMAKKKESFGRTRRTIYYPTKFGQTI